MRPMWQLLRSATHATPICLARAMPISIVSRATGAPSPNWPSTTSTAPESWITFGRALGKSLPALIQRTYEGAMPTPWESWPLRLASTRCSAQTRARSGSAPAVSMMRLNSAVSGLASMIMRASPVAFPLAVTFRDAGAGGQWPSRCSLRPGGRR